MMWVQSRAIWIIIWISINWRWGSRLRGWDWSLSHWIRDYFDNLNLINEVWYLIFWIGSILTIFRIELIFLNILENSS